MATNDFAKLTARLEELRRDWPLLVTNADLAHQFHAFLESAELEATLPGSVATLRFAAPDSYGGQRE